MDALSHVVELLKVEMVLTSQLVAYGPWAAQFDSYKQIKFGFVTEGECHMSGEGFSETLKKGEGWILTNLNGYRIGSDRKTKAVSGEDLYRKKKTHVVEIGNSKKPVSTEILGGLFTFDNAFAPTLVPLLPKFTRLCDKDETVKMLFSLLKRETETKACGSDFILSRAAQLLLLMGLRAAQNQTPGLNAGWLRALQDPSLGRALQLIHEKPDENWSVEALAKASGLSRSGFSARFTETVGQSPAEYLRGWRMNLAREFLKSSQDSVAEIALRVGYDSETAFSTAFRKTVGISPSKFRAA